MITRASSTVLRTCLRVIHAQRNITTTPIVYRAATATDPIQQLFVDKVRLYAEKSKASGGKLVDATPQVEAKYKAEIERVEKQFGVVAGEDFTKFPAFNFQDTELEPVTVTVETKADAELEAGQAEVEEEDDTPFYVV